MLWNRQRKKDRTTKRMKKRRKNERMKKKPIASSLSYSIRIRNIYIICISYRFLYMNRCTLCKNATTPRHHRHTANTIITIVAHFFCWFLLLLLLLSFISTPLVFSLWFDLIWLFFQLSTVQFPEQIRVDFCF